MAAPSRRDLDLTARVGQHVTIVRGRYGGYSGQLLYDASRGRFYVDGGERWVIEVRSADDLSSDPDLTAMHAANCPPAPTPHEAPVAPDADLASLLFASPTCTSFRGARSVEGCALIFTPGGTMDEHLDRHGWDDEPEPVQVWAEHLKEHLRKVPTGYVLTFRHQDLVLVPADMMLRPVVPTRDHTRVITLASNLGDL